MQPHNSKSGGVVKEKSGFTTLVTSYGKDDSDVSNTAKDRAMGGFGGSPTDLSHSLSGTSAKQGAD